MDLNEILVFCPPVPFVLKTVLKPNEILVLLSSKVLTSALMVSSILKCSGAGRQMARPGLQRSNSTEFLSRRALEVPAAKEPKPEHRRSLSEYRPTPKGHAQHKAFIQSNWECTDARRFINICPP